MMALHDLASFNFPASTYVVQTHCPDHNFNFHHPLSLWKYYSHCSVVISTPISSSQINLPWRYYLSESLFYVVFYASTVLFYRFPFFLLLDSRPLYIDLDIFPPLIFHSLLFISYPLYHFICWPQNWNTHTYPNIILNFLPI